MAENSKKALIFGACGFAGRYLIQEMKEYGYHVFGCDLLKNENADLCESFSICDILDEKQVKTTIRNVHPTHIINLAAISSVGLSWKKPQKTMSVNVNGTLNILEGTCEVCPEARILLIGSSEEYVATDQMISERTPLDANNPYGISKFVTERFSEIYRKRYGMKIYHVRAFNHTGIGQSESFVIPSWCRQAANISESGSAGIMKVGNVNVIRDLSDVRDVVRAYRMVIESDNCETVYNIGSGKGIVLSDILKHLQGLSKQPIEIKEDPSLFRPADNAVIICDHSLITKQLGWAPKYDILSTVKSIFESMISENSTT